MEADWDLLAVVRSCTSTTTTTTTTAASWPPPDPQQSPPPPPPKPAPEPSQSSHGGGLASGCENLQDLYKPFFPSMSFPITAPGFFKEQEKQHQTPQIQQRQQMQQPQQILFQQHPQQVQESQVVFGSGGSGSIISVGSIITSQSQRSSSVLCAPTTSTSNTSQSHQRAKKRKNLQKRVCHVPAEGLSSDMWAWRKYGQKPIKGSPYPRGYYRCSSSKGCMARKQVERNRSDPKMFIVTYTAEHNHPMPTHRNSLAGSTRQKPSTSSGETAATPTAAAASTPSPSINSTGNDHPGSSPAASPMTDKGEVKAEYEDEMGKDDSGNEMDFPDMVLNDDFFVGFEELDDTDSGEAFSDQVVGSMEAEYPWLCNSSSSTTTAAGGS